MAGGVSPGCREQAVLSTLQLHDSSHLRQDLPGRDLVCESPGSAAGGGQLTFEISNKPKVSSRVIPDFWLKAELRADGWARGQTLTLVHQRAALLLQVELGSWGRLPGED